MIRYKEIAFTAYAVLDMKKARQFYEGVLGLKLSRTFNENFIEYDIGPGTLVVAAPENWQPSKKGTTAALEVADLDAALTHLKKSASSWPWVRWSFRCAAASVCGTWMET